MHQKIGNKSKFFFYILILIILTSVNNYNFTSGNMFKIKYIDVNGFQEEKNNLIKNKIKKISEKNIFSINKEYLLKFSDRNDTKYLSIKKNYPNKLIINFTPAKPICIIKTKNDKIILGDNGKILLSQIDENILPITTGSSNIEKIYKTVSLLNELSLHYDRIKKIVFFKSGRFDIILRSDVTVKFPINFGKEIIVFSNDLLNEKKFVNAKIIDLRIKNKIIKYE